jgi:predicted dehydrogenase
VSSLRVGVIGVRGIGKYHAKWYARHDCEVAAFAASSRDSAGELEGMLREDFEIAAQGYADLPAMLEAEPLDAVSVCSPVGCHFEHALACLEAGLHVLCEKPFVWDAAGESEALRQADLLIETAAKNGLVLAVNTQYPACLTAYEEMAASSTPIDSAPGEFFWEMQMRDRGRSPLELWTDAAPHPLSLLLHWLPAEEHIFGGVQCQHDDKQIDVQFRCQTDTGLGLDCHWQFSQVDGPDMHRRFGLDGRITDVVTERLSSHEVQTCLVLQSQRAEVADMMQTSISRFIDACTGQGEPLADAARSRMNLACQLDLTRLMGLLGDQSADGA